MKFWEFPDRSLFSRIQSLKSIGNSWGSSYIPCLVPIMALRFACSARKTYSNIKKSQNMKMIVVWNKWSLKHQYWFRSYFFYISVTSNMLQLLLLYEIFEIYVYCNSLYSSLDVINFEIYLLIKPFSYNKECFSNEIGNIHHF